jgi:SdpI/YfhL protein family
MRLEIWFPVLGAVLLMLGWPLARRRIPPNRWYGFRVPADLPDEQAWYDTNAGVGRDLVALGAVLTVVALSLAVRGVRVDHYAVACAAVVGLGALVMAVRAWRLVHRLRRDRRARPGANRAA